MDVRIWFIVRKVYSSCLFFSPRVGGLVYESALELIQKCMHKNVRNPV